MNELEALPYHLRAPRLRWAALAINLEPAEMLSLQDVVTNADRPAKLRKRARLLLGLHRREPIHDLCKLLQMDRRTLYRTATDLISKSRRQELIVEA